jgi:hypothetical protein
VDGGRGVGHRGEGGDGRMLEEQPRRETQAGTGGASHDLHAEDRIAAQLEEVVVDADLVEPKHLAPDGG